MPADIFNQLAADEVRRVRMGFDRVRELDAGYAFAYRQTTRWEERLRRFIDYSRPRLPAFSYQLRDAEGRLWLEITGPPGAKEYLELYLEPRNSRYWRTQFFKGVWANATKRLRSLPGYLIIGGERCGTTSLYNYLVQHPGVYPAVRRDVHFYDMNFRRGLNWYRAFFPTAFQLRRAAPNRGAAMLTGEVTPNYLFHPRAAQRVRETLPHIKLIALLRDPIDRAYSHYQMSLRDGQESLSFEQALDQEASRLDGEVQRMLDDETYYGISWHLYSYQARGVYVDQLSSWAELFPHQQLLILRSEDFYRNPASQLERVFRFLELPVWELKDYKRFNHAPYPDLDAATERRLRDHFRTHNRRLDEFLGAPFSAGWPRSRA